MNFITLDVVDDKAHMFEVDTLRNDKVIVKIYYCTKTLI
jgi:hypothetical protein